MCRPIELQAHADRRPPGFVNSRFAAGQRKRPQPGDSLKLRARAYEKFTAPNSAIGAVTRTVPGDTENSAIQPAVLQHARGNVCMMMLNGKLLNRLFLGPLG